MDEKALPEEYRKVFDVVRSADEPLMTQDVCRLLGSSAQPRLDLEPADCNGGSAQRFVLNSSHDLVSGLADKCGADVRDNGTANGTRLQLWPCSGGVDQKGSTT
ncbi:hypothetical protein [Streptomyces sp. NPDC059862]|uniref:hypothetical protein n=1 Tax=unclassified Streptomyces TaxID=2593676 RepID=UPI00362E5D3B